MSLINHKKTKPREFRDRFALADSGADRQATARLDKASRDRLTLDARLAAVAVDDPDAHLNGLAQSLRDSGLTQGQQTAILVRAWEAAVEGALEDGLVTLDEENALNRYMDHFGLTQGQMDQNGVLPQVVKAAVIRDIAEGRHQGRGRSRDGEATLRMTTLDANHGRRARRLQKRTARKRNRPATRRSTSKDRRHR